MNLNMPFDNKQKKKGPVSDHGPTRDESEYGNHVTAPISDNRYRC